MSRGVSFIKKVIEQAVNAKSFERCLKNVSKRSIFTQNIHRFIVYSHGQYRNETCSCNRLAIPSNSQRSTLAIEKNRLKRTNPFPKFVKPDFLEYH